ncbi:MAG: translocation/assembly module TamB domain-containing protein [Rhodothermales bacterium]
MPKRLLHIPKGLFKLAIFLLLIAAAGVLALMRTQAGRDFVGDQIEAQFAASFRGSLRIGRLHGNLARTFYATNVSIFDPEGRTVLQVDSMVVRLGLFDGLRRNITVRHAELIRPKVMLIREDSLGWNIQRALALRNRERSTGSTGTKWAFKSADVGIVGGSIITRNDGVRPEAVDSLTIFDYTNARLDNFEASATIDWSQAVRLIDLRRLHAELSTQDVELSSFRAQIAVTDSSIAINEAELVTPSSRIHADLRLAGLDSLQALRRSDVDIPDIVLNIDNAQIDSTELSALFPRLHLPNTQVRLLAGGRSGDLHIDDFSLQSGGSKVTAKAQLTGWPDSLAYSADVDEAVLQPSEAAAYFPSFAETLGRLPEHTIRFALTGAFLRKPSGGLAIARSQVGFESQSDLGTANGEVELHRGTGDTLHYGGQLLLSDYTTAAWLPDLGETRLSGDVAFRGSGTSLRGLDGIASINFRSSVIRGVSLDSLRMVAQSGGEQISVELRGAGQDGAVALGGRLDLRGAAPHFEGSLDLAKFNALAFSSGSSRPGASSVSGDVDVASYGATLDDIAATVTVTVDTATFFVGRDTMTLSPTVHRMTVEHPDSTYTQMELTGDVLEGEVSGRFTFDPLIRTISLWLGAAEHTIASQLGKRLHAEDLLTAEDVGREAYFFEEQRLRRVLIESGHGDGLDFHGHLRVKRLRDLHQILPEVPAASHSLTLGGTGFLSADSLALAVSATADSVRGNDLAIDHLSLQASVGGPFDYSLDGVMAAKLSLNLGALQSGSQRLEDLSINYGFADREGSLHVTSSDSAEGGLSMSLDAALNVLPDSNEVRLENLTVRKNDYVWSTRNESRLLMYGDALVVDHLNIRSLHNGSDFERPEQVLALDGIVSASTSDTLHLDARFIRLEEISELGRFQFAIGGEMHAAATIAHALEAPRTAGRLAINALTFDGRDLGNLRLRSVYSSPTEGIAVDLTLTQPREKVKGVQRNDVHVSGTVRPPGSEPNDHGNLNLVAEMPELDMFFFKYLFPNELDDVSGEGSGKGTITGDFSFPQFDASFQIDRSSFLVPEFNLRFGLTGPVTVDRAGFHLQDVALTDPTGGRGDLQGSILFNDYKFFSFDIAADLHEIMIMNVSRAMDLSFYGQVWVSGSATLTGPLQQTLLRSTDAVTAQKSRLYLPVTEDEIESDKTFIVFADSTGEFQIEKRGNILSKRPQTERAFVEGMDMSFNILIPEESSVYLVFDPLLGDVIHALGSGRVQLQRREGDFQAFGTFTVESGDYLFTAGEVFQRKFILEDGGTITWDGDPIDARFDIPAVYRTRASLAGLPGQNPEDRVPIRVDMSLTGRVTTPIVDLRIALDQNQRDPEVIPPGLESAVNQPDLAVEYATSVLLTNTFLLTSNQGSDALTNTADELLFHSLSQLVSSQLNRFVSQALNLDVNVGVQQGRTQEEYDLIYGFALRLDDQRVVIRGEGLYETGTNQANTTNGLQGAFVVEYRLTPAVQLEFFFRRESDLYRAASSLGTAYGVGIVYQTSFANWKQFGRKLRGKEEPRIEVAPPEPELPASD